jgi:ADP-ribose pyrophosphatase YjhB (NUDIX family)
MKFLYIFANKIRTFYWYLFKPNTLGVKCLIINGDKVLLIKNSYQKNLWTIPGGRVNKNKTLENAVAREVLEEVGILVNFKNLNRVLEYRSEVEFKKDNLTCFVFMTANTFFKVDNVEVVEAAWFDKNELPENISKYVKMILNKI